MNKVNKGSNFKHSRFLFKENCKKITFPMLLQLTRKETLSAAFCANVSLVRMLEPEVFPDLVPVDRDQAVGAKDLVGEVRIRSVIRQEVSIQLKPAIEDLKFKRRFKSCEMETWFLKMLIKQLNNLLNTREVVIV